MLIIFSISISPKTFFHDLIADHEDSLDCLQLHTQTVLHKKDHHCHFDDVVVTVPFLLEKSDASEPLPVFFQNKRSEYQSPSFQSFFSNKESRGPPAPNVIGS